MKRKEIPPYAVLLVLVLVLYGCHRSTGSEAPSYSAASGVAQKGPLIKGSLVTAQELDANLAPTGKQYSYQVDSDLGTFSPDSVFTSQYIGINATGYYFDELANAVSSGPIVLNAISDLTTDEVMNVNLLTTLAYQRTINLSKTSSLTVPAARDQAEREVLAAFHIRSDGGFGSFGSLDIGKGWDGDKALAALSSLFVSGNTAGVLSSLIADFQSDLADNGAIDSAATLSALQHAAQSLDPAVAAANLNQKYASQGISYSAADITDWIDQDGDGVVGRCNFLVTDATQSSIYTFPSYVVNQVVGDSLSVTGGQLLINGIPANSPAIITGNDVIAVSPPGGVFPNGVQTIYLMSDTTKIAKVSFICGLRSITLSPISNNLPMGLTQQFVATGTFSDGSADDISGNVAWTSSSPAIAAVNPTAGLVTGLAQGSATITATSGSISGTATLTVTAPVIMSITVAPNTLATGVGVSRQLSATAFYSDKSTSKLPADATWSSSDPTVVTVNAGTVTGVALGTATITAINSGVSGSAQVAVTAHGWMATGSLSTARESHTATLLNNGMVLVAGGWSTSNGILAGAELYNPASNTWSPAGNLITARYLHTATLLNNGMVLVAGGYSINGALVSAELYNPTTNTWSTAGNLATARELHTATLLNDGTVLVAGGDNPFVNNGITSSAELYNHATNTWSPAGNLTNARYVHTATLLNNGLVLVVGGIGDKLELTALESAELYNPTTHTWSTAGNIATARYGHTATLLNSSLVFVVGGTNNFLTIASAELYDAATNTTSSAGNLSTARSVHTATVLNDGAVLIAGGSNHTSAELYNPAPNTWSTAGNLSSDRVRHTATLLGNGRVLVVGGNSLNNGSLASAELFW